MVEATLSEDQLRKGGDFLTRWAAASTFFVQDPVDQDLFLSWIKELFLAGGVTTRIGAVEAAGEEYCGVSHTCVATVRKEALEWHSSRAARIASSRSVAILATSRELDPMELFWWKKSRVEVEEGSRLYEERVWLVGGVAG